MWRQTRIVLHSLHLLTLTPRQSLHCQQQQFSLLWLIASEIPGTHPQKATEVLKINLKLTNAPSCRQGQILWILLSLQKGNSWEQVVTTGCPLSLHKLLWECYAHVSVRNLTHASTQSAVPGHCLCLLSPARWGCHELAALGGPRCRCTASGSQKRVHQLFSESGNSENRIN